MMEQMEPMDDLEIQEKVESLVGKGSRVVDCEKSTTFQTQEVLLVNGFPVPLNGEEGARIKKALLTGQVPPCELLNEILMRAGILKNPVELETTMNVKSTTRTTELLTLRDKNGVLVDERVKEVEEDNEFKSASKEVWKKEEENDSQNLHMLGKSVEKLNLNAFNEAGGSDSPGSSSQANHHHHNNDDGDSSHIPRRSSTSPSCIHRVSIPFISHQFGKFKLLTNLSTACCSGNSNNKNNNCDDDSIHEKEESGEKVTTAHNGKKSWVLKYFRNRTSLLQHLCDLFDPSEGRVNVEINGIPMRVSNETLVYR